MREEGTVTSDAANRIVLPAFDSIRAVRPDSMLENTATTAVISPNERSIESPRLEKIDNDIVSVIRPKRRNKSVLDNYKKPPPKNLMIYTDNSRIDQSDVLHKRQTPSNSNDHSSTPMRA